MKQLAEHIYIETDYSGTNVGAILTRRGFICIDAPSYPRNARDWVARLQQINTRPIRFLILTDSHGDRIVNSRWFNAPIITHSHTAGRLASYEKRFPQGFLDSLTARDSFGGRELAIGPVDQATVSFVEKLSIWEGDLEIQLLHRCGPMAGSIWIYLPAEGILFTGDHVVAEWPPLLAEADTAGWLDALTNLQQSTTKVNCIVSGRGPLASRETVAQMIAYLQRARERANELVQAGRPREDVTALLPEFMSMFPHHLPHDWVRNQVRAGLERVYDELNQGASDSHLAGTT